MDTKFKKTALDDDAAMYQTSKDTITKEDLKNLSGKQKLLYFRDYYLKICIAVVIGVIFIVYFTYTTVINPSRDVLSIVFLNGSYIQDTTELRTFIEDTIGMERKKDHISIEYYDLEEYQMNMVFTTKIGAGSVDLIICTYSDFVEQAQRGMFADLREYLPQEMYRSLAEQIMTGRVAETDIGGNVLSYSEDIPFAIDLSDSDLCAEYVSSLEAPVLCVAASSSNIDNALKAIACFVDQ